MRISPRDFRRTFFDDYFILRKWLGPRRDRNAAAYPNLACFAFDSITSEIIVFGRFEKTLLDVIFARLDPFSSVFRETTAIDIGANIGNHSLYFAERFGQVYAIEAAPETFSLLSFNVAHSGYSNVTPLQKALGECHGKLMFAEHRNEAGRSGVIDPASKMCDVLRTQPGHTFEVEVETGDTVLLQHRMLPVSLIKIDVEGFEHSVIKGLQSTIQTFRPMLLIEQLASEIRAGTSDTVEFLRQWGYDQFYAPESANKTANRYVCLLSKLLSGDSIEMEPIHSFAAKHYPMVLCCASDSTFTLKGIA
ncbi:MAG: FkbM family methyltransferase [Acidobacteriaceae bacterium]